MRGRGRIRTRSGRCAQDLLVAAAQGEGAHLFRGWAGRFVGIGLRLTGLGWWPVVVKRWWSRQGGGRHGCSGAAWVVVFLGRRGGRLALCKRGRGTGWLHARG